MPDTISSTTPDAVENVVGTTSHHSSCYNKCAALATAVSVFVNVVFVVLIVLGSSTDQDTRTIASALSADQAIDRSAVCLDCRNFQLPTDQLQLNRHLQVVRTRNGSACCLRQAEGLWRLLNLMNAKSLMHQKQTFGRPALHPSSAHLYLDTSTAPDYAWTDEYGYGAAHMTSKIKMADGRLQVAEPGYYNIYSSITLKTRSELSTNIHVKHSIRRINRQSIPHTDVILYKSVEMCRTRETFATNYIDGVVKLNAKDEIYVYVSNTSVIYKFPLSNFFGLYLVRSI
ncbi:uncharacterized protein [Haliotis asinina]|uniref:uncharacterized protein n=1 Tax=Haliotis asinina TaxID=109174 RepID=UPI003531CA4A